MDTEYVKIELCPIIDKALWHTPLDTGTGRVEYCKKQLDREKTNLHASQKQKTTQRHPLASSCLMQLVAQAHARNLSFGAHTTETHISSVESIVPSQHSHANTH